MACSPKRQEISSAIRGVELEYVPERVAETETSLKVARQMGQLLALSIQGTKQLLCIAWLQGTNLATGSYSPVIGIEPRGRSLRHTMHVTASVSWRRSVVVKEYTVSGS